MQSSHQADWCHNTNACTKRRVRKTVPYLPIHKFNISWSGSWGFSVPMIVRIYDNEVDIKGQTLLGSLYVNIYIRFTPLRLRWHALSIRENKFENNDSRGIRNHQLCFLLNMSSRQLSRQGQIIEIMELQGRSCSNFSSLCLKLY